MPQQLVYEHDISDDAKHEERENCERARNAAHVETLKSMEAMVRERLEDMFEIVRMHEKTNQDIKKDLRAAHQALRCDIDDSEAYTRYKKEMLEITGSKKSLFAAERERYLKRHAVRMRGFKELLAHAEEYLDGPLLVHGARHKVLRLREIQKCRNSSALDQIHKWDSTYNTESFEQQQAADSTIVSHDAYKMFAYRNRVLSRH